MSQKCAPSGSRQRVVSEAKSSQHDITKAHIKVFKYEQQVVKYDPQLPFSVALTKSNPYFLSFSFKTDILQIRIEMA